MKLYRDTITGETFRVLPRIYKNTSPINEANMYLVDLELVIEPDPIIEEPQSISMDYTTLDFACTLFRTVCETIKTTLALEDFKGGFDEILALTSEQIATLKTTDLLERLTFTDRLCNHEATKVGMHAPLWWYRCWAPEPVPEDIPLPEDDLLPEEPLP